MGFGSKLTVSLLSALVGMGAGLVLMFLMFAGNSGSIMFAIVGSGIMAVIVIAVWLAVFLPFSLVVPHNSRLWQSNTLTVIGAATGLVVTIIGVIVDLNNSNSSGTWFGWIAVIAAFSLMFSIPAVIIGAVTGYVAAYLHKSWDREFEADVKASRLDALGKEADDDFEGGRCKPL